MTTTATAIKAFVFKPTQIISMFYVHQLILYTKNNKYDKISMKNT